MNRKKIQSIQTLFILMIFCVFAVSSLMLVTISARLYKNCTHKIEDNNQMRAALSYVSNKIRSGDTVGGIMIEEIDGIQILSISSAYDNREYKTYLYPYNGYVMEQFCIADKAFSPESGDKITEIRRFNVEKAGTNQIKITAADKDNKEMSLTLSLRTGGVFNETNS